LKTVQTFYESHDYQEALKTLESGHEQIPAGIWHYNMGTIHGKLENWSRARYHFLMAEEKGFSSPELLTNKQIAEQKLEISKLEKPLGASDYATFALLMVVVGILSIWRKASFKVTLSFFAGSLLIMLCHWGVKSLDKSVVIDEIPLHDGPSVIFGSRGEVPAGVFLITTKQDEWLKIIYPSRFEGWVKANGPKELK
jgi:hypothetical protein